MANQQGQMLNAAGTQKKIKVNWRHICMREKAMIQKSNFLFSSPTQGSSFQQYFFKF